MDTAATLSIGPIRCAWRPLRHGERAEPQVSAWLAGELGKAAGDVVLRRDPRGRPRLGDHHGHDVSWSHSGDGLLVALGADVTLGIDLELQRPRPRALALAQRFFTADEASALGTLGGSAREAAFVQLWCAKEAVLKAHGHGLSFGLHRLGFARSGGDWRLVDCDPALGRAADWTLHGFVPALGYVAAVAWKPL